MLPPNMEASNHWLNSPEQQTKYILHLLSYVRYFGQLWNVNKETPIKNFNLKRVERPFFRISVKIIYLKAALSIKDSERRYSVQNIVSKDLKKNYTNLGNEK